MANKKADAPLSVEEVLAANRRKKKPVPAGVLGDFNQKPEPLSTGNLTLDAIMHINGKSTGGIPAGRYSEFRGRPSSGKTTSALQAAAILQQLDVPNNKVAFFDYERTLDETYVAALGVDISRLLYFQPETFEEGAQLFRDLLPSGELGMGIFDSVATMVTRNELESEVGAAKVADRAKMLHQFCRQTVSALHNSNCACVFLNHVMDMVDATPMGAKLAAQGVKRQTSPGGTAIPFYASMRVDFKQIGNLRTKEMDAVSGQAVDQVRSTKVEATVIKNKVGDPYRKAELRVRYGKGFSQPYSIFRVLVDHGAIGKSGATYKFTKELSRDGDPDSIHGEENVLTAIEKDPKWQARLLDEAQNLIAMFGTGQKMDAEEIENLDSNGDPVDPDAQEVNDEELPSSEELDGLLK